MFNCSQLFNTTPSFDVAVCLKKCDYLMSDCLCYCLENKLFEDTSKFSNQALFVFGITGALTLSALCLISIKYRDRYRSNRRIQNNNDPQSPGQIYRTIPNLNNSTTEPINQIDYYEPLPKYEDIITIQIPNQTEDESTDPSPPYQQSHQQPPPNYESL